MAAAPPELLRAHLLVLGLACQRAGAGGGVGALKVGTVVGWGKAIGGLLFSWLKQGLRLARLPLALVLPR